MQCVVVGTLMIVMAAHLMMQAAPEEATGTVYDWHGFLEAKYNGVLGSTGGENTAGGARRRVRRQALTDHGNTDQTIALYVNGHNAYRRSELAADMHTLTWNDDLALSAKYWANQCLWKHGQPENLTQYNLVEPLGQNLYVSTFSDQPEQLINRGLFAWWEEKKDYTYDTNSCNAICGHYTQMAWATTEEVGCALNVCSSIVVSENPRIVWTGATYIVCNYSPAGNFNGQKPYKKGAPCSECLSTFGSAQCTDGLCTAVESTTAPITTSPETTSTATTAAPTTTEASTTTSEPTTTPTTSSTSMTSVITTETTTTSVTSTAAPTTTTPTSTATQTTTIPTTSTEISTTAIPTTSTEMQTTTIPTTSTETQTTAAPTTSTETSTTAIPTTSTETSAPITTTTIAPTTTGSTGPCAGTTCENGGTAEADGYECSCKCVEGWEGDECQDNTAETSVCIIIDLRLAWKAFSSSVLDDFKESLADSLNDICRREPSKCCGLQTSRSYPNRRDLIFTTADNIIVARSYPRCVWRRRRRRQRRRRGWECELRMLARSKPGNSLCTQVRADSAGNRKRRDIVEATPDENSTYVSQELLFEAAQNIKSELEDLLAAYNITIADMILAGHESDAEKKSSAMPVWSWVLITVVSLIVISQAAICGFICRRRRSRKSNQSGQDNQAYQGDVGGKMKKWFLSVSSRGSDGGTSQTSLTSSTPLKMVQAWDPFKLYGRGAPVEPRYTGSLPKLHDDTRSPHHIGYPHHAMSNLQVGTHIPRVVLQQGQPQ